MNKKPEEWLKQAEYDEKAAKKMFDAKLYVYSVFMCHLSVEKALKGLIRKRTNESPPKTHNLAYLQEKAGLKPPEELYEFLYFLNTKSVPTRYPEDLQRMIKDYNKKRTMDILEKSWRPLKWIKTQY